jgi:hypothetical protein
MSFQDELDRERERVVRLVRHAGVSWAEAIRSHKLAPPDDGFASRLERLSEAATAEQIAWQQAHAAGMRWNAVAGAAGSEPPYELRSGTGRRGPEDLWVSFDAAVSEMNRAISGTDALAVASAFGGVAEAAAELAHAIAAEDLITREVRDRARARPAA